MGVNYKTAYCAKCGNHRPIYSRSLCHSCYWFEKRKTPLPRPTKPIQKFSKKRQKENRTYKKLRNDYLKNNPNCERCGGAATDLHHRITRQYHLNDVGVFCSLCRECHDWVHANDAEARKQGYLLSKF